LPTRSPATVVDAARHSRFHRCRLITLFAALSALLVLASVGGCRSESKGPRPEEPTSTAATSAADDPADGRAEPPRAQSSRGATERISAPLVLIIAYGSEKKTWLEEQSRKFEAGQPRLRSGRPIRVDARAMGSGEALQSIVAGDLKPHVFSPASNAYVSLLNRAWQSQEGHIAPLSPAGEPVVLSPLVIAMWKPMAEALGWPKKPLGWRDLLKINANPKGWGALGHPEWGAFKLGHTHPEFSNSGLLSVLAEAYAGAKKTRGLTTADLERKATRDFVAGVERTVVHYGKSTGFFADKMHERGPSYVSAAVLYENLVIESYALTREATFPLVAVYPVEGTFWSDHPFATLDAPWVGPDEREAAQLFFAFLKAKPQQERALALGFRPADTAIPMDAPIDAEHGVDPKQPQTLLEIPDTATLEGLLGLWRESKKAADVVFVFDKSGSMNGKPLTEAKAGAKAFLAALGERDEMTLVLFDSTIYPPYGPLPLTAANRITLQSRIDGIIANGGTALYEATANAYALASERARAYPNQIHAVVVMTDGKDESSKLTLDALLRGLDVEGGGAPVKVFTIAYGKQVEGDVLGRIAEAAQGTTVRGSVDTIVQVYRDMASFF